MDISVDLARVQSRIAELSGTLPYETPSAQSFASALDAAAAPSAQQEGGAMLWPVSGKITSPFGERSNPLGAGGDFHPGLDIAADTGTPIAAAAAGRVIAAGPDGGYGNLIVLDNGNGVTTRYGHCSQIFARVGENVAAGQAIGAVGSTGRSTGPHLHFEVRVDDKPVDPQPFLGATRS